MSKKYELLPVTGTSYFRLRALRDITSPFRDIPTVRAGETGGLVSGPHNLSQSGSCWIFPSAQALDYSFVGENAVLTGTVCLLEYAQVKGNVVVADNSSCQLEFGQRPVPEDERCSVLSGHACVTEYARVQGRLRMSDCAQVTGAARLTGQVSLLDYATVTDAARITGTVRLAGRVYVSGDAQIEGGRQGVYLGGDITIRAGGNITARAQPVVLPAGRQDFPDFFVW